MWTSRATWRRASPSSNAVRPGRYRAGRRPSRPSLGLHAEVPPVVLVFPPHHGGDIGAGHVVHRHAATGGDAAESLVLPTGAAGVVQPRQYRIRRAAGGLDSHLAELFRIDPLFPRGRHLRVIGVPAGGNHRYHSSKIATARVQPADPRCTFTGKQEIMKPSGGRASRLFSFSMWQ